MRNHAGEILNVKVKFYRVTWNQTFSKKLFEARFVEIRSSTRHHRVRVIWQTYLSIGPYEMPLFILPGSIRPPVYDCLFLYGRISDLLPTSIFFLLALPSWRISPPRRSLSKKLRGERSVDGKCHKRKWQFRWENGNFDGRSDGILFASPCTYESLYTRVHTPPSRKKHATSGAEKYFAASFGFLFQSFGGERAGWRDSQGEPLLGQHSEIIFGPRPRFLAIRRARKQHPSLRQPLMCISFTHRRPYKVYKRMCISTIRVAKKFNSTVRNDTLDNLIISFHWKFHYATLIDVFAFH